MKILKRFLYFLSFPVLTVIMGASLILSIFWWILTGKNLLFIVEYCTKIAAKLIDGEVAPKEE